VLLANPKRAGPSCPLPFSTRSLPYRLPPSLTPCLWRVCGSPNHRLNLDCLTVNVPNGEFERVYAQARKDPSIDVKIARLNILDDLQVRKS